MMVVFSIIEPEVSGSMVINSIIILVLVRVICDSILKNTSSGKLVEQGRAIAFQGEKGLMLFFA